VTLEGVADNSSLIGASPRSVTVERSDGERHVRCGVRDNRHRSHRALEIPKRGRRIA
jgi:hypothetical protein